MASIPNRVYPLREFSEIQTTSFITTNFSGSNEYLPGCTAQFAISAGQPVVFSTLNIFPTDTTSIYVSGATGDLQAGIIGVAAADAVASAKVSILTKGFYTAYQSGATAVVLGGMVGFALSGSVYNRVKAATAIGTVIGRAVITGASINTSPVTVFVSPL